MKKYFILLGFFLLFGCNEKKSREINQQSNFDRIENVLSEKINDQLARMDLGYAYNPLKYSNAHQEVQNLKILSDRIISDISYDNLDVKILSNHIQKLNSTIDTLEYYYEELKPQMKERMNFWLENPPQKEQIQFFLIEHYLFISEIYSGIIEQVNHNDYRVNKLMPMVIAESNTVSVGEVFSAKIGLFAYDSTRVPLVTVGGNYLDFKDGFHIYRASSRIPGIKTIKGEMTLDHDGLIITREFEHTYTVE